MRIGPGKIAGVVAFGLWIAFVALLEQTGYGGVVVILVSSAIAATTLVTVHLAIQIGRVRADQKRSSDRGAATAKAGRQQFLALSADVTSLTQSVREQLASLHEAHDGLASLATASKVQIDAIHRTHTDIEWLGDVLQGLANHLSEINENIGVNSQSKVNSTAREMESQVQASNVGAMAETLKASVETLTGILGARSRHLAASPRTAAGTNASRRLNAFTAMFSEARYLEIGLDQGKTFEAVNASNKIGVEPSPQFDATNLPSGSELYVGTSDEFFAIADQSLKFDIVFVDGLHEFEQTYRDIIHSLQHLVAGGIVLVDDVVPCDEVSAIPDLSRSLVERRSRGMKGSPWHGDVFRIMPLLRDAHPHLAFRTIVESGNEQLVLWNPYGDVPEMVDASGILRYRELRYSDVFDDGIPGYFKVRREEDLVSELKTWRSRLAI